MAKRIVVLTGGIGSGKSAAAQMFAELGVTIVDADEISRSLTGPEGAALIEIKKKFGPEFIGPDGSMDRAKMRAHVFGRPESRQALEAIIHPLVGQEAQRQLQDAPGPYVIYVVPLWTELMRQGRSVALGSAPEKIIVIDCEPQLQALRVMQRNGLTEAEVRAIMAAQASREERLAIADAVIQNSQSLEDLRQQVQRLHHSLIQP